MIREQRNPTTSQKNEKYMENLKTVVSFTSSFYNWISPQITIIMYKKKILFQIQTFFDVCLMSCWICIILEFTLQVIDTMVLDERNRFVLQILSNICDYLILTNRSNRELKNCSQ